MGGQRMRRFGSIIHSMDMNLNTLQEKAGTTEPGVLQSMGL